MTLLTTGLHRAIPGSKVLWYDSVTSNGQLQWQNKLNQLNKYAFVNITVLRRPSIRQYFDLCDGIFLNYHWTMTDLKDSHSLASHRNSDVFVGIDVFGRGCFGGGEYNCNMVRAVVGVVSECGPCRR